MPKRSLKEREATDTQVQDDPVHEISLRLGEPQPLSRANSSATTQCLSMESTGDSSDTKESFASVVISPDATPIPPATDESDCRNINADVEESVEPDMRTAAMDHQSSVTLILEKAPLHVAPRLHKERPDRIEWIRESLQNEGLVDKCHVLNVEDESHLNMLDYDTTDVLQRRHKRHRMIYHQERVLNSVKLAHSAGFVKRMEKLKNVSDGALLQEEAQQYDSIYLTQQSWTSAMQSTSSLCKLVDHVLSSAAKNAPRLSTSSVKRHPISSGFACIRPPGHHASQSLAHGYCLINHVAVAAKYALEYHGCQAEHIRGKSEQERNGQEQDGHQISKIIPMNPPTPKQQRRVAILDWDVHHGDGTQSIFWNDPNVLFCSIHAQKAFPFVAGSSAKSVGGPQALGKTVNVAWTSHGMGDNEYMYALKTLILPMLQEFQPTLVLISAGFDAAAGEGYGGNVTVDGFGRLTTEILRVTDKLECPVIGSLEGGYKRSVLGSCVASVVQSMMDFGQDMKNESGERTMEEFDNRNLATRDHDTSTISVDDICPTAAKNVAATRDAQQQYWKFLG